MSRYSVIFALISRSNDLVRRCPLVLKCSRQTSFFSVMHGSLCGSLFHRLPYLNMLNVEMTMDSSTTYNQDKL